MRARKNAKYLRTRASTSPWQLESCARADFKATIVIPALAEHNSLFKTLATLSQNPPALLAQTLIVIVVNNRVAASLAQKSDNQQLLSWLRARPCPQLNLSWVDAGSAGLELAAKDGVGLARKIGFDLALTRLDWSGEPLLVSLDADALVDPDYLGAIFSHFAADEAAGAYLPFRHQSAETQGQEAAIRSYELYLRSYLFGLQWVGSPYAFISIGSALACRAGSYVDIGGMKRRQAGEDFYFLQQLVKQGKVGPLGGTVVRPSARFSSRVPFGTGRAVQSEVETGARLYRFVSADSFRILKVWQEFVAENLQASAAELVRQAVEISPLLGAFLAELDFSMTWEKLQANFSSAQLLAAWHNWFDGLRTRQLLSRLEELFPARDPELLVAELLTLGGQPGHETCTAQLQLLERLQAVPAG